MGHYNLLPRWSHIDHPNYGAAEFGADLAQCRNRSVMTIVSAVGYNVQSGGGVDEVKVNACMAIQGWQQAPPSVVGIARLQFSHQTNRPAIN